MPEAERRSAEQHQTPRLWCAASVILNCSAAERALPLEPDDPISKAVYDEIERRGLEV